MKPRTCSCSARPAPNTSPSRQASGSSSSVVPVSAMAWCGAATLVWLPRPTEKPSTENSQKPSVVLTSTKVMSPVNSLRSMKPKL